MPVAVSYPGVYVEETSFRAKSIEGVGTSTTAFVGHHAVQSSPRRAKYNLMCES